MRKNKYLVNLSDEELVALVKLTRKGEIKAGKFKQAIIFLSASKHFYLLLSLFRKRGYPPVNYLI